MAAFGIEQGSTKVSGRLSRTEGYRSANHYGLPFTQQIAFGDRRQIQMNECLLLGAGKVVMNGRLWIFARNE